MRCPSFSPPMKFRLDKSVVPVHLFNDVPRPFTHNEFNFQVTYEKTLTAAEIETGYLVGCPLDLFANCFLVSCICTHCLNFVNEGDISHGILSACFGQKVHFVEVGG